MRLPARLLVLLLLFQGITLSSFSQVHYVVKGRVIDFDTRQPIASASVTIRESQSGTVTNDSGFFSINVFMDEATLQINSIGYTFYTRSMHLNDDNRFLLVSLKRKANEKLDEIVINAFKDNAKVRATEMNIVRLSPEAIKRAPLLFGEADLIRALITQPGVTNAGEAAGGFNVRGGNADQNLVLLDGAPLFNTSHLLGFYTAVTPDLIQDATLHKGGMPAEYGGRVSSLLTMRVKNGFSEKMNYSGGVSPVSVRFNANGPIIKDKLAITGGVRAAFPNLILNQFKGKYGDSKAFFYDALLKPEFQFNNTTRLSVTAYRSYDKFRFDDETEYEWQTDLLSLNFNTAFNKQLSLKINANTGRYESSINGIKPEYESSLKSSISHTQGKIQMEYKVGEHNKIQLGGDYILYSISPGTQQPASSTSNIIFRTVEKEQATEMAVFASTEIDVTNKLTIQAGLRYAGYQYRGAKKVYQYEEGVSLTKEAITDSIQYGKNEKIQGYAGFEPRIAIKYGVNDDLSFKVSYNRGQQFLHLISNTTAISPVDFWKLSDNYIRRQIGDQFAAGVFRNFKDRMFELGIEAYYKNAKNVVQYKDGATLLLNPYIETGLLNARSKAYGVEFSFSKNVGKFTGQVNYTYSRTQIQVQTPYPTEVVNNGEYYAADADRPHNLAVMTKVNLGKGWNFNANFIFTSGRPATYPDGFYAYNSSLVTNYSQRNRDRLPAYHRLDIGFSYITKRAAEQKRYSVWNISFYNVYMRDNAYSIYFNKFNNRLKAYQLSVIGGIIPSVTWNFYF